MAITEKEKVQYYFRQDPSGAKGFEIATNPIDSRELLSPTYFYDQIENLRFLIDGMDSQNTQVFSRIIKVWFNSKKLPPHTAIQDLYGELLSPFAFFASDSSPSIWEKVKSEIYQGNIRNSEIDKRLIQELVTKGISPTIENAGGMLEDFIETFSEIGEDLGAYINEFNEEYFHNAKFCPKSLTMYNIRLPLDYRKQLVLNGIFTSGLADRLNSYQVRRISKTRIPKNFDISSRLLESILYRLEK